MNQGEMVVSKLSQIPRYPSCDLMGRSVECEVFVVSVDGDDVRSRQKDMPPGVKSVNDCKKFSVVDIVISFCLVEGTRYTSDGSKSSSIILLRENSPHGELGRIHF